MGVLFYNKCRVKTNVLNHIELNEAEEKDVNFYDYDGFRLLSYTNAEALALTELPENPAGNKNLTFDEWNWTLTAIKNQINNVGGVVNVGAIYHTADDKTHITCKPTVKYPYARICLTPSDANAVTVDWGDGTTDTWTSALSGTISHTYTGVTDSSVYDIAISCTSGTYSFATYITGASNTNIGFMYTDIKLSNKVTGLGTGCFSDCTYLESINIPNTVTSFGTHVFNKCSALRCLNLPSTITSAQLSTFYWCFALKCITLPYTFTNFGEQTFYDCNSLTSITIPYGVTTFGELALFGTAKLKELVLPNTVSNLGRQCFSGSKYKSINLPEGITTIPNSCFASCNGLFSLTMPSTVTTMGSSLFSMTYTLCILYMKPTTPPTTGTSIFQTANNLVIYVPTGSLSAYQSAENWSTYSSKMREYNFN